MEGEMESLPLPNVATLEEVARVIRGHEYDEREFVGIKISNGVNHCTFRKTPGTMPERKLSILPYGTFPSDPKVALLAHVFRPMARLQESSTDSFAARALVEALTPTVSVPASINSDNVVARALSALGCKTIYESPGSSPPLAAQSWPEAGARIDCSGFVAWCFRMPRKIDHPLYVKFNNGWFETSALHHDGLKKTGLFVKINKASPGCLVVYPDKVINGNLKQGHVGVVLKASGNGIDGIDEVIHCSVSSYKKHKDAIKITGPEIWRARDDAIIIQYGE
jgi:cell wall-associated NlpC family hydrolase